jgi:SSS family solute:Na+ symporter
MIDWLVVAGYAVFAIGVGIHFARRASSSADEFFLSGRSLPWWLTGTSMVATTFAADTPLVISGWVRDQGIWMNWQWWCFAVGGMLTTFIFARYWRRGEVMTIAELAELRYGGRQAEVLRGFLGFVHATFLNTIILCWVLLAAKKIMGVLFEVGDIEALVIASVLALSYSLLAGFWGVVITDIVQFTMAMIGAVLFAWIAWGAVGGLEAIEGAVTALGPEGRDLLRLVPRPGESAGPLDPEFWTATVAAFALVVGGSGWASHGVDGGPTVVQRIAASRTPRDGLLGSLWYNVANYALRPWPWIAVGLASLVVLPTVIVSAPVDGRISGYIDATGFPGEIQSLSEPGATGGDADRPLELREGEAVRVDWNPETGAITGSIVVRDDPVGTIFVTDADGGVSALPLSALEVWGSGAPELSPSLLGRAVATGETIIRTDSERAYIVMMLRYLPVGLLGLVVASLLAAFMSTIDTHVNLAASYYVNDVHRRFIAPGIDGQQVVLVARIASTVVLILGATFAYFSSSISDLFQFFLAFLGGVGPVYVLRWLWWRVTARAELVAMATSILATVLFSWTGLQVALLGEPIHWPLGSLTPDGDLTGHAKVLVVVLLSLGTTLLAILSGGRPDPRQLVRFYEKVRPIGAWGPVRELASVAPPPGERRAVIVGIGAGLSLTYALLFGLGFLILGRWTGAGVCLLVALPSIVGVASSCRTLGAQDRPDSDVTAG